MLAVVFGSFFGTGKKHDSQGRDRILHFLLRPEIGQFSPHFGAISLPNYTENLEKREKSAGENNKKKASGDGAPKLQISVPCRGRTRPDLLTVGVFLLTIEALLLTLVHASDKAPQWTVSQKAQVSAKKKAPALSKKTSPISRGWVRDCRSISIRKILVSVKCFVRNSGAGNGCANFMGAWKNAFCLQEKPCPKIPPFSGGGGGECRLYFLWARGFF